MRIALGIIGGVLAGGFLGYMAAVFVACEGSHVQGMHQSRTFLYDPHTRMPVTMNAAFVGLGLAKPAFQVEVVARARSLVASYE